MNTSNQAKTEAFRQHINDSERFYQGVVAALAIDRAMQQLVRVPKPPRRWWLLRVPCRTLLRGCQWLGRRLFSLAFRRRSKPAETWREEVLNTNPIIIDVCAEPFDHHSQRSYPHTPSRIPPLRQSQAGEQPRRWVVIGSPDEDEESGP